MLIRPKRPGDDEACVAMMYQTHRHDGYPRYWPSRPARFLRPAEETDAWVAEVDGRVVGHVALHDAAAHATLDAAQQATGLQAGELVVLARLLVDPRARGAGVGRALLATATDQAYATGRRPVLDVLQGRGPAVLMYEAAGWTRLGDLSLDLRGLGYGDVPPLELWVYLAPLPVGREAAPLRRPD